MHTTLDCAALLMVALLDHNGERRRTTLSGHPNLYSQGARIHPNFPRTFPHVLNCPPPPPPCTAPLHPPAFIRRQINLDTARMLSDRVLLQVKAVPKGSSSSAAGVLIAESATRSTRPTIGQVVKVGPGRMVPSGLMMPMYCEVGDCVKYKVGDSSLAFHAGRVVV